MEITVKKLENSKIEVVFEVPAEELDRHVKTTNTLAEASEALIKESWQKAVQEKGLEPIGPAQTSVDQMVPGQPAKFRAVVPVLPEVKLPDYHSLVKEIKKEEPQIGESDVDEALKSWQLSQASYEPLNRPTQKGDFVQIEFSSSLFPGNQPQQDRFVLGEGRLIPGFEDQLVGMSAGEEKDFTLTYPDPYFVSHLAGKEAQFHVKMLKAEKVETVPLEELMKKEKVAESMEELRQQVRSDLEKQAKQSAEQRWRQELLSKIAEGIETELPEMMIEYEQMRLIESLKRQVSDQLQISFEDYLARINQKEEDLKKTYRLEAEKNVREFLTLRALSKAEGIEVSEDEVAQEAEKVKSGLDEKQRAEVDQAQIRAYTKDALTRDRLFRKLAS